MKELKDKNNKGPEALTKVPKKGSQKREEYIEKITTQLKEWDKELSELEHKAGRKFKNIKKKFGQKMEETKIKRDVFRKKLHNLEKAGEEASKDVKNDFEMLWRDIKKGIKSMREELK